MYFTIYIYYNIKIRFVLTILKQVQYITRNEIARNDRQMASDLKEKQL